MSSTWKTESAALGGGVWILSRMGQEFPAERVIAGVAAELEMVQRQGADAWGKFGDGVIEMPRPDSALSVVSRTRSPALFRRVIRFCRMEKRRVFLQAVAAEARSVAIPAENRGRLLRAAKRLELADDESGKRDLRECLTAIFSAKAGEIADLVFRGDDEANAAIGDDVADLFGVLSPAAGCAVNFCNLIWWKQEYGVSTIVPDSLRREIRDARKMGEDLYLVRAPFAKRPDGGAESDSQPQGKNAAHCHRDRRADAGPLGFAGAGDGRH